MAVACLCYRSFMSRLEQAMARIDDANSQDPNLVESAGGPIAKELLYSQRMSRWLARLAPAASENLQIACRASHIRRWESARSDFPAGRAGYKKWRSQLLVHHAQVTVAIMAELGYPPEQQERVAAIIKKQGRTTDDEVQTLEDVACLVFLEHEFDGFVAKHEDESKLVNIVAKTWSKMSSRAHEHALALSLAPRASQIVQAALTGKGE